MTPSEPKGTPIAGIPEETTLMVCPTCGRTDRYATLGRTKHYRGGSLCPGEPVKVRYRFAEIVTEPSHA